MCVKNNYYPVDIKYANVPVTAYNSKLKFVGILEAQCLCAEFQNDWNLRYF